MVGEDSPQDRPPLHALALQRAWALVFIVICESDVGEGECRIRNAESKSINGWEP
jgi:hypothetical protein